jgi:Outer membrane protein beta-barrel domain
MKKLLLALLGTAAIASGAFAGTETYSGKEMKQVAPLPCPAWYADREFNVGVWGTYLFTGNEWREDRYVQADHAWGGGIDLKYFFCRYFGVGFEGWVVSARRTFDDVRVDFFQDIFEFNTRHESRAVASALATLTFRYPIPCSRFAPYAFVGGGGIFGGGERTRVVDDGFLAFHTEQTDTESELVGQFGGGVEFRITPHIGWINDFSWNVVNGSHNNFGMVRSGLNFAF